ncbi:hypothetical protein ACPCSC_32055 [Streptomyces lavendulocolor]|uniref:hypothetical protein n=1 Tax=Streptomyces lavendulocolor TaxID=67316 RepID=UPI003C2EB780
MTPEGFLIWLLITVQVLVIAGCAVLLKRRHRRDARHLARTIRRTAAALFVTGVLPVPALLATDAPAAAWGLWGAATIAAALVYATADTLRDIPANRAAPHSGSRP